MNTANETIDEKFYIELVNKKKNGEEMNTKEIYSLFPDSNPKTISWRLHKFVQQGKLTRIGRNQYLLYRLSENNVAGYDYIQKKSQTVYNTLIDYGYDFYISGLDSLIGEINHIPEKYSVLLVVEDAGVQEIKEALFEKDMFVCTEKERHIISMKYPIDVIILKGRDFKDYRLSDENIAQKEKGFVDLYYAVTRLEYEVSIQELSRIYQSLRRNQSISTIHLINAAKDRGINDEINWLVKINKLPDKTLEFMRYQIKEF
jgi:hypothetical protein